MTRFSCPKCQTVLQASPEQAGKTIACPTCKAQIKLPPATARQRPAQADLSPRSDSPPPVPGDAGQQWYYAKSGQTVGPVTEADLKALARTGELTRNDMVWKAGLAEWVRAESIRGLFSSTLSATPSQDSPPLPPVPVLPATGTVPAPGGTDAGKSLWQRVTGDKLLLLGCCLGITLLLTWIVPPLAEPPRRSALEAGWDAERLAQEVHQRQLANRLYRLFFLADIGLAVAIGVLAYRRFVVNPTNKRYASGVPGLPFETPWSSEERSSPNTAENVRRFAALGVGCLFALTFLLGDSEGAGLFALWLLLVGVSLIAFGPISRLLLYGRWVPVDGTKGWVEFHRGGVFKQEDGLVGTFVLLPNNKFIDFPLRHEGAHRCGAVPLLRKQQDLVRKPVASEFLRCVGVQKHEGKTDG